MDLTFASIEKEIYDLKNKQSISKFGYPDQNYKG